MKNYLVFQLYGPMASWGEIAVGELRHSAYYPSKSALIGLIGAALGIERANETEQNKLINSFNFFVKLISSGCCLQDYHTTQNAPSLKNRAYHSRREVFTSHRNGKKLSAILSTRDYWTDSLAIVAITLKDEAMYSLELIAEAMLRPKFHLYLGRKSCPLSLPLYPIIQLSSGPKAALDDYTEKFKANLHRLNPSKKYTDLFLGYTNKNLITYYWEANGTDLNANLVTTRYDQPINKKRWQFAPRQEYKSISQEN